MGLRDISVVIFYDAGEKESSRPWNAMSRQTDSYGGSTYATLTLVNLTPRQLVRLELLGVVEGGARTATGWQKIEFVAQRQGMFGTKGFRKVIASR